MVSWPVHLGQCLIVLLVLAAPLPLAAAWVERLGSVRHSYGERLLAVSVFWIAIQVSSGIVLGLTHLLTTPALAAVAVLLLVAGLLARPRESWSLPSTLSGQEAGVLMVIVVAGLVCAVDLIEHPTRNFDSLAYHLPVMARWVSFARFEVFADLGQIALYPSDWELLSTFAVLPMHEDLLVSLVNLFAWVQPDMALAGVVITALAFLMRGAQPGRTLDAAVAVLNSPAVYIAAGTDWSRPVLKPGLPAENDEAAWLESLRRVGVEALLIRRSETDPADLPALRRVEAWLLREGN